MAPTSRAEQPALCRWYTQFLTKSRLSQSDQVTTRWLLLACSSTRSLPEKGQGVGRLAAMQLQNQLRLFGPASAEVH